MKSKSNAGKPILLQHPESLFKKAGESDNAPVAEQQGNSKIEQLRKKRLAHEQALKIIAGSGFTLEELLQLNQQQAQS